MKTIAICTAGLGTLLTAGTAHADISEGDFTPALQTTVVEFPWESGFIPNDGPLRLNLTATARQNIDVSMPGSAHYDWENNGLIFRGDEEAGLFINTVQAEITAVVAVDVFGLEAEFEVGIWDLEENVEQAFTPYVLPGNEDSPVGVAQSVGPYNLVTQDFDIAGIPGTFVLDVRLDVPAASFSGTQIDIADQEGGSGNNTVASVTEENQVVDMLIADAQPGGKTSIYGQQLGTLDSEISLHLLPSVTVEVSGITFDIGPFDVAVEYPLLEDEPIAFEEIAIELDVPEAPEEDPEEDPDDDGDDGDDDGDDGDDGDDDSDDDDGDDDDEEDEDLDLDPTDPGFGGGVGDDGCGCTSGSNGSPMAVMGLLGLCLVSLRRRRR